jgi:hypothetical protein
MRFARDRQRLFLGLRLVCATWCVMGPAHAQTHNACHLLDRNPDWAESLSAASARWNVKPGVMLAVIDQESRFRADARGQGAQGDNPPRNFGYAQANLRTWNWFLRETGRASGSRTDFALSVEFVGWHFAEMERRIGAPRTNTTAHYLAYKLGEGGYRRGGSAASRTLASQLVARAERFDRQLEGCLP